jgi:hippurate hydrolase
LRTDPAARAANPKEPAMPIKNRLAEMHDEIKGWRRALHRIPELQFDLPKTTAFVEARLREIGIEEITTGVGRSGIVAVIEGQSNTSGRVIGLRADMDALPIEEASGVEYASTHAGKMHACGHDGHTAMLLGAAKYLFETRNFDGKVALIFQPAEEGGAGGDAMVRDGLMERFGIDEVYGMHNSPGIPVGEFAIRPGALMASADQFDIVVTGRGGHAGQPHTVIDTNLAAAHVMLALQSVVSRNADPLKQLVVSVCTISSDTDSYNVIPQTVTLKGTVRALDNDLRKQAAERIEALSRLTAEAYGCSVEIAYEWGYPVTMNDPEATIHAADAAAVIGAVDRDTPPIMPAEDFSYMLEARPGAYMFLGNGDTPMCHHPAYDFDDEAIPVGCSWFAELVERRLPLN